MKLTKEERENITSLASRFECRNCGTMKRPQSIYKDTLICLDCERYEEMFGNYPGGSKRVTVNSGNGAQPDGAVVATGSDDV